MTEDEQPTEAAVEELAEQLLTSDDVTSIALAYHCLKTGSDIITGFKYLAEQRPGILSNTKFIEQLVIWADSRGLMPTDM